MKYNYFLSLVLIQCEERLTSLPSARVRFRGTFPIAWKGRVCLNLSGSVYFIFACYLLLPSLQIAIKQQSKNQILQPTQSRELTYLSALLWLTAISVYLCVRICIQQETRRHNMQMCFIYKPTPWTSHMSLYPHEESSWNQEDQRDNSPLLHHASSKRKALMFQLHCKISAV